MAELDKDLRDYIDGIASPVTTTELQNRKARAPRPRPRPIVAVLAGAAVVLIPMLALVAITLWPSNDEVADPPVATSSTATTTSGALATEMIVLIDFVGFDESTAIDIGTEMGLDIVVTQGPVDGTMAGLVIGQSSEPGAEIAVGSTVELLVARSPNCDYRPTLPPLAAGEAEITVLFGCASAGTYPNIIYPATRRVPASDDQLEQTIHQLLRGPSSDERAAGFESFFGPDTEDALISVMVDEAGATTIDFNDAIYVNNASTSTGGVFFNAELNANVFQYPAVGSVEYRINGRCEAWAEFFQSDGCWVTTREDWNRQVTQWDAARMEEEDKG